MAGAHTGFAPGAAIQVDAKPILLAGKRALQRDQILVILRFPFRVLPVPLSEPLDGRQLLLLGQQFVQQR
jgi:hypothetical protein